jgi:hypothetical protein
VPATCQFLFRACWCSDQKACRAALGVLYARLVAAYREFYPRGPRLRRFTAKFAPGWYVVEDENNPYHLDEVNGHGLSAREARRVFRGQFWGQLYWCWDTEY